MKVLRKICLIGDGAVGKTSLIRRFVYDMYDDRYISTIGTKVTRKWVETSKGVKVHLIIWDILGQKHYEEIHSSFYQGASGAMVVCDLTREETFINLEIWIEAFKRTVGETHFVLIGNKVDLVDQVVVSEDMLKEKAFGLGIDYFITSAKTGKNVEKTFNAMANLIVDKKE